MYIKCVYVLNASENADGPLILSPGGFCLGSYSSRGLGRRLVAPPPLRTHII